MKTLIEYINENIINIFENESGGFAAYNWKCGSNKVINYNYSKQILKDLIDGKSIKTVFNVDIDKSFFNKDSTNSEENLKKLLDLCNISKSESSDLSKIFNKEKFIKQFEKQLTSEQQNKINNKKFNIFTSILKKPYSGGSTKGGNAEALVCYYFNHINDSDVVLKTSDLALKLFVNFDKNDKESYYKSTINSAERIKKEWSPNKYFAIQVGCSKQDIIDQNINNIDENNILGISNIFSSNKEQILKSIGLTSNDINLSKLFAKRKDEWNKADIVLINKDLELNKIKKIFSEKLIDVKKFNRKLDHIDFDSIIKSLSVGKINKDNEIIYTIDADIIPISLKKSPGESANLYQHNINEIENLIKHHSFGTYGQITLPADNFKNDSSSASIYLTLFDNKNQVNTHNKDTYIAPGKENGKQSVQIYSRTKKGGTVDTSTAKMELTAEHSKEGSGFSTFCKFLGISTKDAYYLSSDKDKIINAVVKYFGWGTPTQLDLPKQLANADDWYKKPCIRCVTKLLDVYSNLYKSNNKNYDIQTLFNAFVKKAYDCCLGDGAYYIIK